MNIVTIELNKESSPITVKGVKYQGVILGLDEGVPELTKKNVYPTSSGPEYANGKKRYVTFVDDDGQALDIIYSKQLSVWFLTNPIP